MPGRSRQTGLAPMRRIGYHSPDSGEFQYEELEMELVRMVSAGLLAASLGLSGGSASAASQDTGEALGAMRAIFYHELGHALIDVLDLPLVGVEEDVVDEFSAMMLILQGQSDNRHIESLFSVARYWYLSGNTTAELRHYWDTHGVSVKRGFGIICLLHGSDPGRYYKVMEQLGIPQHRARRCEQEFAEKRENWLKILGPHFRGNAPAERQDAFQPLYLPAESQEAKGVAGIWRQTRFVESLTSEVGQIFPLPRPVPVIAKECGMANAFWDGRAITLCYELHAELEDSFQMSRTGGSDDGDESGRGGAEPVTKGSVNVGDSLGQGGSN